MVVLAVLAGCTHTTPTVAPADTLTTSGPFPAVSGAFGSQPDITFDTAQKPDAKLQRKVLSRGRGPALAIGDLVAADYVGQIWNGKVFDNSYASGQAAVLQFGLKKLLPGIDAGLLGVPVGSRVELTLPPTDGYGSLGDKSLGIKPTDTLVYVFDIAQRYNGKSSGDGTSSVQPAGLPVIGGPLDRAPLITVPKNRPVPSTRITRVISRGDGASLRQGSAIIQFYSVNWDGGFVSSTWLQGTPTAVPVGAATDVTDGVFDGLVGLPIGSRVLIVAPAPTGHDQAVHTAVIAVDILAQVGTAKQMATSA